MIFALLTLLAALALAAVAGWFSIVGFMAIYAGAPMYALIMGVVTECAKLVTTSWVYRNWDHADWKIKGPLIYFTLALMTATSIGVFGFLSKAHLEQGAGTIDNSAKIVQLQYQIDREKSIIADNEKLTKQLDDTVNSFLGKDRADRALSVRRSQASQRAQLRADSAEAQKRIDALSAEKFKLESEVRKMQLDVGPIRYIAELFYGVDENATKNIEAAVRIFTLLLVSTLDPLAVILLIAANHTLIRLRNEKKEENKTPTPGFFSRFRKREEVNEISGQNANTDGIVADLTPAERVYEPTPPVPTPSSGFDKASLDVPLPQEPVEVLNEEKVADQGAENIQQPQADNDSEGEWKLSFKDTLQETPITEGVGRIHEELRTSESEIDAEVQTPLPIIDNDILNEKQEPITARSESNEGTSQEAFPDIRWLADDPKGENVQVTIASEELVEAEAAEASIEATEAREPIQIDDEKETTVLENFTPPTPVHTELHIVRTPSLSRINNETEVAPVQQVPVARVPWAQQDTVLQELLGNVPHFAPQRLNEKEIIHGTIQPEGKGSSPDEKGTHAETGQQETEALHSEEQTSPETSRISEELYKIVPPRATDDKYPKALSWLTEFRRL